ncbi:MAG: glycosidase, partial [Ruminococcus sp.]|nr:glycosidase [Ruminococcus sp.]
YVSGDMAYIKRYTAGGVDSLACVAVTGGATFKGIPNGKYIDAVSGDVKTVSNGTLSVGSVGKGNMRVYVCCASGFQGISGAVGPSGQTYLK